MSRLLTVVNERKKLRNQYRMYLENQYIDGKKAQEEEAKREELKAAKERGEKVPMMPDELSMMKKQRDKELK